MVDEVLRYLRCTEGGIFVDGTLGTGGHTLSILQHSPATTQVIGMDRDPEGLAVARERLKSFSNQLHLIPGTFGNLREILSSHNIGKVDGILLDLGFSSFQIDTAGRGFSFQNEGPLDMRMDQTRGIPAGEWLARSQEKELAEIFQRYGEERWSKRIARRIKGFQKEKPLETTKALADLIARTVPRGGRIHPATRVFQALRIQINDELGQLKAFLDQFLETLKPGGRVCLIAYHSLEDRLIKQAFLELEKGPVETARMPALVRPEIQSDFQRVTRKPVMASPEEVRINPRARGAKLRVGERRGDLT
jgi:16S rRNA (cytosine1402-N4)-methyltransferase